MIKFHGPFAADLAAYNTFRTSQGFSESTHAFPLVKFDRYCGEFHPDASVLTREIALDWLKREVPFGLGGLRCKTAALRGFANYVNAMGGSAYVLPVRINPPMRRKVPHLLTDAEMTALFSQIDRLSARRRDVPGLLPTLFRVLYTCGLRPNEVLGIRRPDVDFGEGTIRIVDSKFHKDRAVAMSADMKAMMREYFRRLAKFRPETPYVFPGRRQDQIGYFAVRNFLNRCWAAAAHELGDKTPRTIRLYDFRHRFASAVLHKWLDEGRNILEAIPKLRIYMGHVSILSTLYYVHLLPESLRKSHGIQWEGMERIIPEDAE